MLCWREEKSRLPNDATHQSLQPSHFDEVAAYSSIPATFWQQNLRISKIFCKFARKFENT